MKRIEKKDVWILLAQLAVWFLIIILPTMVAFFSTHEWWSKNLREVHDIKAGSMVMDVLECEQYINENDIRVITKA